MICSMIELAQWVQSDWDCLNIDSPPTYTGGGALCTATMGTCTYSLAGPWWHWFVGAYILPSRLCAHMEYWLQLQSLLGRGSEGGLMVNLSWGFWMSLPSAHAVQHWDLLHGLVSPCQSIFQMLLYSVGSCPFVLIQVFKGLCSGVIMMLRGGRHTPNDLLLTACMALRCISWLFSWEEDEQAGQRPAEESMKQWKCQAGWEGGRSLSLPDVSALAEALSVEYPTDNHNIIPPQH